MDLTGKIDTCCILGVPTCMLFQPLELFQLVITIDTLHTKL